MGGCLAVALGLLAATCFLASSQAVVWEMRLVSSSEERFSIRDVYWSKLSDGSLAQLASPLIMLELRSFKALHSKSMRAARALDSERQS